MQRVIIAFVIVGVLALGGLYAGDGRLTGWGAGRSTAETGSASEAVNPDPGHHTIGELNGLRCDASLELVSCDRAECALECDERYAFDPPRLESCNEKCDSKVPRKLKRPNRRYDCDFDTCDSVDFDRMLDKLRFKYLVCEDKVQVYELGQEALQKCLKNCDRKLDTVWSLARQNNCRSDFTDTLNWSCEDVSHAQD
jgi:hypothetical protein